VSIKLEGFLAMVHFASLNYCPGGPSGAPGPFALADVGTLKRSFSEAGFRDIEIDISQITIQFDSPENYTRTHQQTNAPINCMLAKYAEEVKNMVWDSITKAVWQYADSHGSEPG
jgi:hypothetical protein